MPGLFLLAFLVDDNEADLILLAQTHDLFKCKRCKGGKQSIKSPAMLYGDTSTCVPSFLTSSSS